MYALSGLTSELEASYPALAEYLARLHCHPQAGARLRTDAQGRVQGNYFKCTLTSCFQPIRELASGTVSGHEGFARSHADTDPGLSVWKLLDQAASDDESVELDRLCRVLHVINFFRQSESAGGDLYLSVHARLLAAVEGDHGTAFSHVLELLGLPHERIVLQLPAMSAAQAWLLAHVAGNYRRKGFRIALNAADLHNAAPLVEQLRPHALKIDSRQLGDDKALRQLLGRCREQGVMTIVRRLDSQASLDALLDATHAIGGQLYAQGFLLDLPDPLMTTGCKVLQRGPASMAA